MSRAATIKRVFAQGDGWTLSHEGGFFRLCGGSHPDAYSPVEFNVSELEMFQADLVDLIEAAKSAPTTTDGAAP